MSENTQISFWLDGEKQVRKKLEIIKGIIIDRKSKYTLVSAYVENRDDIDVIMKHLLKDKYISKSNT